MPAAPEDVNVPSDPAPQTMGELPGFKFNLGHQETDRIIDELEQVCKQVVQSAGDSWMTCTAAANIVCNNLGYEDQGELEVCDCPCCPLDVPLARAINVHVCARTGTSSLVVSGTDVDSARCLPC
jgi:hypothetical protein